MSQVQHTGDGCPRCREERHATLYHTGDRLFRTTDRTFDIVECAHCGLIRLSPMPTPDELKSYYPQSYWWDAGESTTGRLAELYRQFVLNDHVRFAARAVGGHGPVLDVGGGGGSFLHAMGRHGIAGCCVDVSAKAAAICWSRYGITAASAMLPHLPFYPGSFSAVTMFHVLEHLPDPMAALREVHQVLAPGGRLVVQVPNAACWQLLLLGDRWSGLDVPRHLINFRDEDLDDLLISSGFEPVRKKYFSMRDNPAGLATSLFPGLEPVSRKVRGVKESAVAELAKNLLYLALVVAAVPITLLEAAGLAGSTVMVEAIRRGEA